MGASPEAVILDYVPVHHGDAWRELKMSPCANRNGWRGCNLIDNSRTDKTVNLRGFSHQEELVSIAQALIHKACASCIFREWAKVDLIEE
jgi:hypothetical protein